jgi:selenide,water dikinase
MENQIKLTSFSHGAGCGCKLSPKALESILKTNLAPFETQQLLVGNNTKDDAAVYDYGDGTGIISTTDFFMPIVDDPFMFGKIAATNAISDIYAMGGSPMMAIAILGWPINEIPAAIAQQVLDGARETCKEANIPLAGGHSIESKEPIFGLAVTGKVELTKLKRNDSAKAGSKLYLTKPLGVGILSTAEKQGKLLEKDEMLAKESMMKLNNVATALSCIEGVSAMADVTGFGLLGHLLEICEGSNVGAKVDFNSLPIFEPVNYYIEQGCVPGGTKRNWKSYGEKTQLKEDYMRTICCDAQTSGGLLIAVCENDADQVEKILSQNGLYSHCIGELVEKEGECWVSVL